MKRTGKGYMSGRWHHWAAGKTAWETTKELVCWVDGDRRQAFQALQGYLVLILDLVGRHVCASPAETRVMIAVGGAVSSQWPLHRAANQERLEGYFMPPQKSTWVGWGVVPPSSREASTTWLGEPEVQAQGRGWGGASRQVLFDLVSSPCQASPPMSSQESPPCSTLNLQCFSFPPAFFLSSRFFPSAAWPLSSQNPIQGEKYDSDAKPTHESQ